MLLPGEISVDSFAGGGGASTGICWALNRPVDIAINHNPPAIDMHQVNHPGTKHYCESVWDVDPVEAVDGRRVGLAWFSPDCRHFSRAKGSKPVDKNIRGLAWVAVKWALRVPVRLFFLENVTEFTTWGPVVEVAPGKFKPCPERQGETFRAFIRVLTTGLSPAHPAWKEMITALDVQYDLKAKLALYRGLGYHIEYRPQPACDVGAATSRTRFFMIARKDGQPIRWPEKTYVNPKFERVIPGLTRPWKTAADIIDWSIPVKSIYNRKKPLAPKTMVRIRKGIQKFVFDAPEPFVIPAEQLNFAEKGQADLVTFHMIKFRGNNIGTATDDPVPTISAGGLHIGEVRAFLVKYNGTSIGQSLDQPLQTITGKHRFGLVVVKGERYRITDIGLRMLEPHELYAAMGFPADYIIDRDSQGQKVAKSKQVGFCGNAVSPLHARALVEANVIPPSRSSLAA